MEDVAGMARQDAERRRVGESVWLELGLDGKVAGR